VLDLIGLRHPEVPISTIKDKGPESSSPAASPARHSGQKSTPLKLNLH